MVSNTSGCPASWGLVWVQGAPLPWLRMRMSPAWTARFWVCLFYPEALVYHALKLTTCHQGHQGRFGLTNPKPIPGQRLLLLLIATCCVFIACIHRLT